MNPNFKHSDAYLESMAYQLRAAGYTVTAPRTIDDIEPDPTAEEADLFDTECALWTGSLAPVIDDVILALGGEA